MTVSRSDIDRNYDKVMRGEALDMPLHVLDGALYKKIYRQSPKYKASQKKYQQSPEYKLRKHNEYLKRKITR
jgi:hypothetical protein